MATTSIIPNQVPDNNSNKTEEYQWESMKPVCEYCQEPIPLSIYLNDEYFPYCDVCVNHLNYMAK